MRRGRLLAGSPGLRLLTTSREPLRIGAQAVWQVPPLSVAPGGGAEDPEPGERAGEATLRYEAVRLFGDRTAAAKPGFVGGAGNVAQRNCSLARWF